MILPFSHFFLEVASLLLIITLMVNLYCFFRRVGLGDKVLCLDLLTMQLINGIALICFYNEQAIYLDVILLLACIIFLTTTSLAFYLSYH